MFWKISTHLYYVFFINPTLKGTIVDFPFNIWFIAFSLYYFFNSKLFLICFFQFFFVKCPNSFFVFKIIHGICPQNNILTFCNHKNLFRPIWNKPIYKNVFIFCYIFIFFDVGYFSLISLLESIYVLDFTSAGFILIVLWYVLLYLWTRSSNLSIYAFFWFWSHIVINSIFQASIFQQQQIFLHYVFLTN